MPSNGRGAPATACEPVATGEVVYIHPVSAGVLRVFPFLAHVPIFGIALQAFHPKFLFAICVQRLLEFGLANALVELSIQPMLTGRYGLTGAMYQRLSTLYTLGWAINAFFTVIADTFAVFGYTKRWYCLLSAIGGGIFALLYALLPAKESSGKPAAAFMFVAGLFMSNVDVFSVALYSEQIRRRPTAGPALVSWIWGVTLLGMMTASVIQGPLSDHHLTQVGVYITAGIMFFCSLLFVFNLFEERRNVVARREDAKIEFIRRHSTVSNDTADGPSQLVMDAELTVDVTPGETKASHQPLASELNAESFTSPRVDSYLWGAVEMNRDLLVQHWRMGLFCLILTLSVVANAVVNIFGTRWEMLYASCVVTLVVCGSSFVTLPRTIAKVVVFIFLNSVLYLNLPGVLNTFYVAPSSCLADGPHFSYTFYNLMNGILGKLAGIAGTMAFTHLFPQCSYRFVMSLSAVLLPFSSMFDLIILKRWNAAIGIPDRVMYIGGDAIIYQVFRMLLNMPTMMLMCRVAPRGSESMVFALLASVYFLGSSTSSSIGYVLIDTVWPVVTRGVCNYDNAPWLVLTGHIVAPTLILPLAYLLLPAARICDNIDHTGRKVPEVQLSEQSSDAVEEVEVQPSPLRRDARSV